MFFELEGVTYKIKFFRIGTNTYADLYRVDEKMGLVYTELQGYAYLHPKDRFVKSSGRKVALTRLLYLWKLLSSKYNLPALTKEAREYIWAMYFMKHTNDKK